MATEPGSTEERSQINLSATKKILLENGVTPTDLAPSMNVVDKMDDEKMLNALLYREIIWAAANKFSDGGCEMTHSEYKVPSDHPDRPRLDFCMEFFEKSYEEFGQFLSDNPGVIPQELRDSFDVHLGFNYGNDDGLKISKDNITPITQEQFMDESNNTLRMRGLYAPDQRQDKTLKFMQVISKHVENALSPNTP